MTIPTLRSYSSAKGAVCYDFVAILVMAFAVIAVYWPPPGETDSVQLALDYWQLHSRRMQFARDALFGSSQMLPAWYPRELLGTPFTANSQNFPFIPTRLVVLLTMAPDGPYTYAVATSLSATLASILTYLYMRKVGLGILGSAASGWTFACSGYYASRVAAGHLPMLEGYPALPALLWTVESLVQAQERNEPHRRWVAAAVLSSTVVMLAGHPQLPFYALSVTGLYVIWRVGLPRAVYIWSLMALGIGIAAFMLVPMVMLIGRSTRLLALAAPSNDVPMPYGRLAAFFFPWRDGVPSIFDPLTTNLFHGYPSVAYFWDTVCYTGLLPWLAVVLLLYFVTRLRCKFRELGVFGFALVLGVAGIVLSLPVVHQAFSLIPGTILRSPSRFIYLTEFALAMALGIGVHCVVVFTPPKFARIAIPLLFVFHIVDLGGHDRRFILRQSFIPATELTALKNAFERVHDGRTAIDYRLVFPMNRAFDDVGVFDSIMLARPYRTLLSLANAPRDLNVQAYNASDLPRRALDALGVRLLMTAAKREEFISIGQIRSINIYEIPSASRRAEFFATNQLRFLSPDRIHAVLRDSSADLSSVLLLPQEADFSRAKPLIETVNELPTVDYRRPDSDHIEVTVATRRSGYLRILESWDPGWSATVNGLPVKVVPALDALIAVPLPPGQHKIKLVYRTPGVNVGIAISIASFAMLCLLICQRHGKGS